MAQLDKDQQPAKPQPAAPISQVAPTSPVSPRPAAVITDYASL